MDAMQLGNRYVHPVSAKEDRFACSGGYGETGITLRQHFAGLAMQGLMASPGSSNIPALQSACASLGLDPDKTNSQQVLAVLSVNCADALLAELSKDPT